VAGVRVTVTNFMRAAVPILSGSFGAVLGPASVFVMDAVILAATGWLARHID
jgi:hypothetical protein